MIVAASVSQFSWPPEMWAPSPDGRIGFSKSCFEEKKSVQGIEAAGRDIVPTKAPYKRSVRVILRDLPNALLAVYWLVWRIDFLVYASPSMKFLELGR